MRLKARTTPILAVFLAVVSAQVPTLSNSGINVANVPDCAKVCLTNSTQYATECPQIDVKCLCDSADYISALSCCLASTCNAADQQTAIQFNIQECAAVNATVPNFVGCSPFSLSPGASKANTLATLASGPATTVTGSIARFPTAYTTTKIGTASFAGGSILTGSCTVPLFAQVTDRAGNIEQFPEVGCDLTRGDCCPFDPAQYFGLTNCPDGYATTSGACCPAGYSVYSTNLGAETPCFTRPSLSYIPASATSSGVTLISDTVFTKRYVLVSPPKKQLPTGGIVGITINAVLFVALPFVILWLIRRHKKRKAAAEAAKAEETTTRGDTFPPIEPDLQQLHPPMSEVAATPASPATHELSPESARTPVTTRSMPFWSLTSGSTGPGAYAVPSQERATYEMPGSMHIHEHHPMFTRSQTDVSGQSLVRTPPQTPPRSPAVTSTTRSPMISPSTSYRTESPGGTGMAITPLGTSRPPLMTNLSTRFQEGQM